MKRLLFGITLVLIGAGLVWGIDAVVDTGNLSLKAGPTEAGEKLSLVWVEAFVYPRVVKEDRVISLGVRTASKVAGVKATFDFTSKPVALTGDGGVSWSTAYNIGKNVPDGVHVVRYQILGNKGAIQRTVEFFVEQPVEVEHRGETLKSYGWPLTVNSTGTAFSGSSARILYAGQKLTGLSRLTWYKVLFEDGQEGWVSSNLVSDPGDEYCRDGYEAYRVANYAAAVSCYLNAAEADPGSLRACLGLAKSYLAQDNLDAASAAVQKALRLDERDIDSRVVANELADKYYSLGHNSFIQHRYQKAVANFRKAIDLKGSLALAWTEMGECLHRLGLESEARDAWREALRVEPQKAQSVAIAKAPEKPAPVAQLIAKDSLQLVKEDKTSKGTKIASAIKSVVALTRSLGTPVVEKGWKIRKMGEKTLVSYLCEQGGGALESFDWLVDVDTRQVLPHNDNARLLMSRW